MPTSARLFDTEWYVEDFEWYAPLIIEILCLICSEFRGTITRYLLGYSKISENLVHGGY